MIEMKKSWKRMYDKEKLEERKKKKKQKKKKEKKGKKELFSKVSSV